MVGSLENHVRDERYSRGILGNFPLSPQCPEIHHVKHGCASQIDRAASRPPNDHDNLPRSRSPYLPVMTVAGGSRNSWEAQFC